jgi:hypothetical protein
MVPVAILSPEFYRQLHVAISSAEEAPATIKQLGTIHFIKDAASRRGFASSTWPGRKVIEHSFILFVKPWTVFPGVDM